jgi:replicative DNA helicase
MYVKNSNKVKNQVDDFNKLNSEVPIHSDDAEKSVLSAMMIDKKAVPKVLNILQPEHFFNEKHALIFSAIQQMFSQNKPVDLVTVWDQLERLGISSKIETHYLAEINSLLPTSANAVSHAYIVLEKFIKRQIKEIILPAASNEVIALEDSVDHINKLQSQLIELQEHFVNEKKKNPEETVKRYLEELLNSDNRQQKIFRTGFNILDGYTNT